MTESNISRQIQQQMNAFDSNDINAICQPMMKHFAVDYVCYSRVYRDSSEVSLTTHPQWLEYYLNHQLYSENPLEKSIENYTDGFTFWSKESDGSYLSNMIEQQLQISQAFIIIKPNLLAGYCDFYYFGSKHNNTFFKQNCVTNTDLFSRFIDHFGYHTTDILNSVEKKRIIIPNKFESNVSTDDHMVFYPTHVNRQQFMTDLMQDGLALNLNNLLFKLTKRETQMAHLLVSGMCARQIAESCHISRRTVETHIINIKEKLHVRKKSDLVRTLMAASLHHSS
ncbi:MAG: helix-turn-helix transcriptional regulator [Coxiellaceae bacterium]|nr:helix-turn-helix transcriptional regulator [Coxiellaceae bacterium]